MTIRETDRGSKPTATKANNKESSEDRGGIDVVSVLRVVRLCVRSTSIVEVLQQQWQMVLNNVPDDAVVNDVLAMHQDVSERDDLPPLRNLFGQLWGVFGETCHCLTDDHQFSLDRCV